MTRALPFTEASIARRIKGVEKSGWYPIGVTADGTVLIGEKPLATASLVQADAQLSPPSARRFGERLNGAEGQDGGP